MAWRDYRWSCPSSAGLAYPIKEQKEASKQERQNAERENSVTPPPAPFQVGRRAGEVGQCIDIRKIRPNDQGGGAERGPFAQSAPRESRAYERMADRVYSSLASMSTWTLPFLAASAAFRKPAESIPGT